MPYTPTSQKRTLSTIPILLTSLSIILTSILHISSPTSTINFPLLTLNTTSLTPYNPQVQDYTIPNVYNIYLQSHCLGYYWNHSSSVVGLTCFSPSPSNLPVFHDTELSTRFATNYLPSLHAAFALYILSLILLSSTLVAGFWFILYDERLWKFAFGFVVVGDVMLAIACIITTTIQKEAATLINQKFAETGGVSATYDNWFLGLSWTSFGFGILAAGGWAIIEI